MAEGGESVKIELLRTETSTINLNKLNKVDSTVSTDRTMSNFALAVNCGSSSIKFQLYRTSENSNTFDEVVAAGGASSLGSDSPVALKLKPTSSGKESKEELKAGMSHEEVFEHILEKVTSDDILGEGGKERVTIIAHRIVHGGTEREPVVIKHGKEGEEEALSRMEAVSDFAPLHNHHAMLVVRACLDKLPTATSVLCFDTLFHSSIPDYRTAYAVSTPPHKTPVPLVKYGFHGLSYASVLAQTAKVLDKPESQCNLVVAHLGSGGSVCWIKDGRSANTSMGLTPLEGLPGGTRSGTVDPSLIFHHTPDCSSTTGWAGRQISKAEMVLNKESGFKALCGTDDFGKITKEAFPTNGFAAEKDFLLTYNLYLDHILQFVASYVNAAMAYGKLDGIVFAGGIGEKSSKLREDVLAQFAWVEQLGGGGGGLDKEANEKGDGNRSITKAGSKVPGFVCETDEELVVVQLAQKAVEQA